MVVEVHNFDTSLLIISLRNGIVETFFAEDLVPGDVIILNIGDRVPADVRLFEVILCCSS